MTVTSWDALDQVGVAQKDLSQPFWAIDRKDEQKLRDWIWGQWDKLSTADQERFQVMMANIAAYRGIHYKLQDTRTREMNTRNSVPLLRQPRIVVNMTLDAVETQVSKITKYRPAINATPSSEDQDDKNTAKIAESVIDDLWQDPHVNIDEHFQTMQRHCRVTGEGHILPLWDEWAGDFDPDYKAELRKAEKEAQKAGKELKETKIPLKDPDTGAQMLSTTGDPLFVDKALRQGEVDYLHPFSWDIQYQPRRDRRRCEWFIWREYVDIDELRADHPDKAHEIKEAGSVYTVFDPETFQGMEAQGKVEVIHLFHKSTKFLGQGWYVKCTRDAILKSHRLHPEYEGELPLVTITDMEPPGCLRGYAVLEQGRQGQSLYNNLTSLLVKSIMATAHPKWMMPKNCCAVESLGNDATVVQYVGPQAPVLATPQGAPPALFSARKETKEDFNSVMAISGVAQGRLPPGVRAARAIAYLDETDNERQNTAVSKHNNAVKLLAMKTAWIMAHKYGEDNERIKRIIGKGRYGETKFFEIENLRNLCDWKVQDSSALPKMKGARIEAISTLSTQFPGLMPQEQVVDLLELGQVDKFVSVTTAAVRKADTENEQFMRSGEMPDPEAWEQHLIHYKQHLKAANDPGFEMLPEKRRQVLKDHIRGTEMLMMIAGKRNPLYMQQVLMLYPTFPALLDPEALASIQIEPIMPMPAAPGAMPGTGPILPAPEAEPGTAPLDADRLNAAPPTNASPVGEPTMSNASQQRPEMI